MENQLLRDRAELQILLGFYRKADTRMKDIEASIIEECVRSSSSPLGFFGFINEDETEMTAHLWSEQAMAGCAIDFKPVVFSLDNAGIWAEAIRKRQPFILNDYSKPNPRKKGLSRRPCPDQTSVEHSDYQRDQGSWPSWLLPTRQLITMKPIFFT